MSRLIRWVVVVLLVAGTVGAGVYAPAVLRDTEAFRVRQVEVVGTRYIDPFAVIRAAGLDRDANLFDDVDAWRAGARTHPLVEDVRVRRAFPSGVTLEVVESEPVALVARGTLRPVDATGRLLELDPAGEILDLPIMTGAEIRDGRLDGASAAAIHTVTTLLRHTPDVAGRVSQLRIRGESLRLAFRDTRAEAVLPVVATPLQLTQLRLALADLGARGELDGVRTIDLRYRDQVVVSFLDRPVS